MIDLFVAHHNLLQTSKNIIHHIRCGIQFVHIKGHQDKGIPMVLSREAWLNNETNELAKAAILQENQPLQVYHILFWPLVPDNWR